MGKIIKQVVRAKWNSPSPARVNRKTGVLQLNVPVWDRLSDDAKVFVFLHEEGHVALDSADEMAVDEYAFKKYAATGRSLKGAVRSLTEVLSGNSPDHLERAKRVLQLAIDFDKNKTAYEGENWNNMASAKKQARQQRRVVRKERKEEKKQLKVDKKSSRIERKNVLANAKAQKKVTLANQGVSEGAGIVQGIGSAIGGLASIAGAAAGITTGLGAVPDMISSLPMQANNASPATAEIVSNAGYVPGGAAMQSSQWQNEDSSDVAASAAGTNWGVSVNAGNANDKKKNLPYIIGGVVLLVVVVVVVLVSRKK